MAAPVSADFIAAASFRSVRFQPRAASMTSHVPRVPEPGLPMLTRLPFRSVTFLMPVPSRARIVTGSGWTEKTARRSLNAPAFLNFDVPL